MLNWTIAAVVFFIIEMITPSVFFFACLGLGALAAGVVAALTMIWWMPWMVFAGASMLFVIIIRPIAGRFMKKKYRPSNADALIGKKALVLEEINQAKSSGLVKIDGERWKAEARDIIPVNSWVKVLKVDGTHLEVEKEAEN